MTGGEAWGTRFWVDSGHVAAIDAPDAGTFSRPFATLAYAFSSDVLTASSGDEVHIAPGHSENVASAAAIAIDIAGVKIIGHGWRGIRPKFMFITSDAATITVTAADVWIENLWFECNKTGAAHANMITVSGARCTMSACVFTEGTADEQTLDYLILTTGADDFRIDNCEFYSYTDASDAAIVAGVALDSVHITNCIFRGDYDEAVIEATAAAATYWYIAHNHIKQLASAIDSIEMHANSTGEIEFNGCYSNVSAGGGADVIDGGECRCIENYAMDEDDDTSGKLTPPVT
jgi:hypothetical protein